MKKIKLNQKNDKRANYVILFHCFFLLYFKLSKND